MRQLKFSLVEKAIEISITIVTYSDTATFIDVEYIATPKKLPYFGFAPQICFDREITSYIPNV